MVNTFVQYHHNHYQTDFLQLNMHYLQVLDQYLY